MRYEECHSHIVQEIRAVALKPTLVEVAILPVNLQGQADAEHQTVERIFIVFLDLIHEIGLDIELFLELEPINLLLGRCSLLLLIFHLHFKL